MVKIKKRLDEQSVIILRMKLHRIGLLFVRFGIVITESLDKINLILGRGS